MGWMENLQNEVGQRIRDVRTNRGWTQAHLAEKADLPTETVSRIERGVEPNPTMRSLGCIAQALGMEHHELFLPKAKHEEIEKNRVVHQIISALRRLDRKDLTLVRTFIGRFSDLGGKKKG
ncbi:MAG: helix-turn-helix transcriptional regulator [Nitrospirae bacterium]|nr:helix-turn-helix transcriptional regulator [Nitrospirota bacterium]